MQGQVFEISILAIREVLLVEFGGKGDHQEIDLIPLMTPKT